jgi:hypothetical protein
MLATNPAHVARFNTMKAAMEAFPEESAAFKAAIAANLASSDLTAAQQAFLLQD